MDQQLHSPMSDKNLAGRAVPAARSLSDFSFERVDEDLIILDGETLQYHTLNGSASQIWGLCDGKTTSAEIAHRLGLTVELVEITVADLGVAGLLESPAESFSWTDTMNRRRAMKLVAAGAAGAVGLPVVLSLTAPSHQAAATISGPCRPDAPCSAGDTCQIEDPTCVGSGIRAFICIDININNNKGKLNAGVCVVLPGVQSAESGDFEYVEPYSPEQSTDSAKPAADTVDSAPPADVPVDAPVTTDLQTDESAPPADVPADAPVTTDLQTDESAPPADVPANEPVTTESKETPTS